MQPGLHGSHRYAQNSRSLLRRQLLNMKHVENFGVDRPQSIKRLSKKDAFWAMVQDGLDLYDVHLRYNEKSNEVELLADEEEEAKTPFEPVRDIQKTESGAVRVDASERKRA